MQLGSRKMGMPDSGKFSVQCFVFGLHFTSKKESGFCSSQHRLDFIPTVKEIEEYVLPHLQKAPNPIASFGQGCEGEPLLKVNLIEESIKRIRSQTSRGILNINTNASLPKAIERICIAGINSMRVSLIRPRKNIYTTYYQPKKLSV